MSDILTPDQVEVADGLMLADLQTIEDYEMALLTLTRDIGRIEEQLDGELANEMAGSQWAVRAASGLRFKKALRQQVTSTLADMRKLHRAAFNDTKAQALVDQFKADWPAQFDMSSARAKETRRDLWK